MMIDAAVMAPAERAEAIREVIWSSVVRVEITHQSDPRLIRTVGAISGVGPLKVCSVRANATTIRRTPALTHDDMEPSLFVGLQVSGSSMVVQDGREAVLQPGDLALYDTTRPYTLFNKDGIHQHFFRIPRTELALPPKLLDRVTAVRFDRTDPLADLTATCLRRIARHQACPAPSPEHGLDAAARPGIQLLRALVTARLGDQHLTSEPWRETLHLRILDYVRAHLGDDDLTPARIAAHHHVSRRQLYTTLARHGVCLSEWIRTQRLERCRDELAAPAARHRSIAAIARHWGFPNAAHFSRTFKQAYDLTPSDWRALHGDPVRSAGLAG
ncbi:helix-turn-helix domain-containing protein [Streptomyces sp. NPDC058682]|uniref:AraC-like ligand-binding domain-containing protein n=1 Tax=unclassified Streptomyces TaxID=2593676 RepID=UPI00224F38A4|nr:helix-turn-helix domain-containing protein [Streptomyces sp. NBC_01214]MCX4807740.1 helix-turn-helix domain-containing protein [Streptomyces sp. NBC_01214]